jgi:hypothetical protein
MVLLKVEKGFQNYSFLIGTSNENPILLIFILILLEETVVGYFRRVPS